MKVFLIWLAMFFSLWPTLTSPIKVPITDCRPAFIDAYFLRHHMPLAGTGENFVEAADREGIDWRLLAAIAVRESSGGLHEPAGSFNAWGWKSGRWSFNSYAAGIDFISAKLATAPAYAGKDLKEKLAAYNPPSVLPQYPDQVIAIMESMAISPTPLRCHIAERENLK